MKTMKVMKHIYQGQHDYLEKKAYVVDKVNHSDKFSIPGMFPL
jgi:hypothetical protein